MARAGLTTERLTRAGAELADEVGFDQVTVSALARRFDVKVASLYSHVRNSQDLRTRIALLALDELADRAADALAGRAGQDALAALGDVYRDYAREHPGRYAAAQLRLDPETAAASAGGRHAEMTRAILRGYDLTNPTRPTRSGCWAASSTATSAWSRAAGSATALPTPQETWTRVLDALDALLRNWPAP